MEQEGFLTVDEVAQRLAVPLSWVYARTAPGARDPMPHVRLGKYVRLEWAVVEEWIRARQAKDQGR